MKLFIKNMISPSCELVVKTEMEKLGIPSKSITSGEVELEQEISPEQHTRLRLALKSYGLELVSEKKNVLAEKIRNIIIDLIHYSNEPIKVNFSHYLSQKLNYNYTYLSNQFSESQGITIEKLIIEQKIEKVKQLLATNELNLTEIAYKMNYSSVAHLSSQFKKVTGVTPSYYKGHKLNLRLPKKKQVQQQPAAGESQGLIAA